VLGGKESHADGQENKSVRCIGLGVMVRHFRYLALANSRCTKSWRTQ